MFFSGGFMSDMSHVTLLQSTPNFKYKATNCILLTICICCICVLVIFGVLVVREYALSAEYESATCRLLNTTTSGEVFCTYCSGDDGSRQKEKGVCVTSHFPCIQVIVEYRAGNISRRGQLYVDSLQASGEYYQCSFSVCLKQPEDNKKKIDAFARIWEDYQGRSFHCFHNTQQPHNVIAGKKHSVSDVVHGMLWPSVVIAICGIIFLRVEMKHRGYSCTSKRKDDETTTGVSTAILKKDTIQIDKELGNSKLKVMHILS